MASIGVALGVLAFAGCDSGPSPTGSSTPPLPSSSTSSTSSASSTPPTAGGTTPTTPATPATSGPATPAASPGTFAIAVAGAGQVGYPVSGVTCTTTTVVATATPTGGGTPGTVTLDVATGALTVADLPPLDGTRLTGAVAGTPGPGATVRWTGDGTGSAASLSVTCP